MPANEYEFIEEWNVPARIEDVWDVLSDARVLPDWWRGVYLKAEPIDEVSSPTVGARIRAEARGFLPYHLRFTIEAVELVRPSIVSVNTYGDLTGTWRATLTSMEGGTKVRTVERVSADKPLLRLLSPFLKPLFERNHYWTTPRAESGLRAYLAERGKLLTSAGSSDTVHVRK